MRSAREGIVEAALARFAEDGFDTPLRTIAADADVSAALILHHFGSKAGLRAAVDEHVLNIAHEKLRVFDEAGAGAAIAFVLSIMQEGDVPRYIARSMVDDDVSAGSSLFTAFVDVTEKALIGLELPDPRMTAAILVVHSLGTMMLARQVKSATGTYPYADDGIARFGAAAFGIYQGAIIPLIPSEPLSP